MVYPLLKIISYPIFWLLTKSVKGQNNIPKNSKFIVVSNHEKFIDPFYIITPIVKKLNKKVHFIANPTLWFLGETICRQWAGCIPLFEGRQSYNELVEYLGKNKIVGIFPEALGYRTKKKIDLKTGVVRLAIQTNTPILPIGVKSSFMPFSSTVNIGKLIYLKNSPTDNKRMVKELMKKVYELRNGN